MAIGFLLSLPESISVVLRIRGHSWYYSNAHNKDGPSPPMVAPVISNETYFCLFQQDHCRVAAVVRRHDNCEQSHRMGWE